MPDYIIFEHIKLWYFDWYEVTFLIFGFSNLKKTIIYATLCSEGLMHIFRAYILREYKTYKKDIVTALSSIHLYLSSEEAW